MHIHTILHNVIYICVLSIFWYVVQQPQYWEEGGGGGCSLLFGWPKVDEELVLERGDLGFLVLTGESYGRVPVLMIQQEGQLQKESCIYLFISITTCTCTGKYYRFWHLVKIKTQLGVKCHSTCAKCTYKTHKYFLLLHCTESILSVTLTSSSGFWGLTFIKNPTLLDFL